MRKKVIPLLVLSILMISFLVAMKIQESIEPEELSAKESICVEVPSLRGENYRYHRDFKPVKSSSIDDPLGPKTQVISHDLASRFSIQQESNETHAWVEDPTNQTAGYFIPKTAGLVELNASRGQTYRHWYNETSSEYTYASDQLVNKSGVIPDTDWVTNDEYPHRFILRLTNNSIRTFETPDEISNYITLIDNNTIWGVGYESFGGVMGFYLNFADLEWGHGQYLYWPRLLNGQITAYNQPLYAIYPHLYANYSGTIYDKLLNDRSLYTEPYQNPRNTLSFFNTSDTFGLYFTTYDVPIFGSTWNFVHGFKYNKTDQLYHLITRMECTNRDFDDVGMAYEITSSPQSDNTPYQPDRFLLSNDTHEVTATIEQAWEAGAYLQNFYSRIEIFSQNNESFRFTFGDMEEAGFTRKYLNLHDQQMYDGSTRKVLRAGMYGYGSYAQNTWLEIDPDTGNRYTSDNFDLCKKGSTWNTGITVIRIGIEDALTWDGFVAYNTGIETVVLSITSNNWQGRLNVNYFESGEGVRGTVYNIKGNADGNTAKEDSLSYSYGAYYYTSGLLWQGPTGGAWFQADATQTDALLEYWADYRDSNDEWISFHLSQVGAENEDYLDIRDTQSSASYIQFTYTAPTAPTAAYVQGMANTYAGKSFATIKTDHADANGAADVERCDLYLGVGGAWYGALWYVDTDTSGETGDPSGAVDWGSVDSVSEAGITNGFRLTWTLTLDWDFPYDDADYDVYVRTYDEGGLYGSQGWTEAGTTTHETELIVYTLSFELNDTAFSEDGNTALTADEWYRGGADIRATGTVTYEGTTNVYPPTTACDVELSTDGTARGEDYDDDELGASGQFTTPYWETTMASGLDIIYALDVTLTDFVSGASEGSGGAAGINVKRDNEIPTSYSLVMTSGWFYADITNDSTPTSTVSGATDGSGSGIHAIPYYYGDRADAGTWNEYGYTASTIYTPTISSSSNDVDFRVLTRDKVGNTGVYIYDNDNTVDLTAPTIDTFTPSESSEFLYYSGSGTNGYYGSLMTSAQTFTFTGTASDNFNLELINMTEAFGDDPEDLTPSSYSLSYSIEATDNGDISILIVLFDQAGNRDTQSFTFIEDNTGPTITDVLSAYEESGETEYVHGSLSTDTIYFSDLFSSNAIITVTSIATDVTGISVIEFGSFGGDVAINDSTSPYQRSYTIDISDVSGSITIKAFDNVMNSATDIITMTEDITPPSSFSLSTDELYNWGVSITVSGTTTDSESGMADSNTYEWWINSTRIYGTQYTTSGSYTWANLQPGPLEFCGAAWDNVGNFRNATSTTVFYVFILVFINPQPEIEEIENTGYYNDDDVYYDDIVPKITSVEEMEQTKETGTIVEIESNDLNITEEYVVSKNEIDSDTHIVLVVTKIHKTTVTPSVLVLLPMMLFYGGKKKKRRQGEHN